MAGDLLMELKAKDADRMNFENDQFLQMFLKKSWSDSAQLGLDQAVFAGGNSEISCAFLMLYDFILGV